MSAQAVSPAIRALDFVPSAAWVMTSAFEVKRSGTLVQRVQLCADEPLLISVAVRKGHAIEPLIRDSHAFAICRIDPDDKLLTRKFAQPKAPDDSTDLFDSIEVERLVTPSPVIKRCYAALDCIVARHIDLESDFELYVGQVVSSKVFRPLR
jgi:flavin reductase (DIM6/NTAB) family NADH-FMN oxidoreductase RutF